MKRINCKIDDQIFKKLQKICKKEGISINKFLQDTILNIVNEKEGVSKGNTFKKQQENSGIIEKEEVSKGNTFKKLILILEFKSNSGEKLSDYLLKNIFFNTTSYIKVEILRNFAQLSEEGADYIIEFFRENNIRNSDKLTKILSIIEKGEKD